jgi:hypothetical protein
VDDMTGFELLFGLEDGLEHLADIFTTFKFLSWIIAVVAVVTTGFMIDFPEIMEQLFAPAYRGLGIGDSFSSSCLAISCSATGLFFMNFSASECRHSCKR